ncbi:hypothetical protein THOM_1714 [Trachipleistophora hominis]|uniref:Uncharacterized protein n=1 Tax=Trachipleistophora hominis TaxID=72359 RepID=L7JV25_TRAHO|nr:hypothetical protein THOM_1714 [Trachipleistophora hominis]
MNWDRVNSLLNAFKKLNRSLQVQELKAIECKQPEYKFVIAYFFKELKNKTSIALMNKFGVRDDGNRQEFELKIIEEIKRSGLLFRNIKNEFQYEFYDELINGPAGGVVLAMQFRCDDFDVIFDRLCECKVLEIQFMRNNLEHVIRKLLSGGVLNDFGLRICEELQGDIYQSIKEDINSGKYDSKENYHPFYSNERLKEAVDKRNDVNAYKLLCLRDVCDQYYILNRLFTFYEKGIIRNYGCILGYNIKIDLNIFEKFINANKLIGREIFVFLSNFTALVPADILRIVDIKMVGYLDPFLRKKCSILLPKGYYEIDLRTEQIFLDGMSDESGSKDTIIPEEGQVKRENT